MTNQKNLIDRVTRGDEDAFAQLMELYAQGVYTLIVRITRCEKDAEELTQDVFMRIYNHIGEFAGKSSFSTWLYRIAYNIAISYSRRQKQPTYTIDERRLQSVELSDVERMEAATDDATIKALTEAIEKLESHNFNLHFYTPPHYSNISSPAFYNNSYSWSYLICRIFLMFPSFF